MALLMSFPLVGPESFRDDFPFPRSGGFAEAKEKGDKGGCFQKDCGQAAMTEIDKFSLYE